VIYKGKNAVPNFKYHVKKTRGGIEAILQLKELLSSVLDKDSQLHVSAALPTGKELQYIEWEPGWVPESVWAMSRRKESSESSRRATEEGQPSCRPLHLTEM
jgi:hypothetical protein